MSAKDIFRLELLDKTVTSFPAPETWGRIAERLRRLPAYRQAKQIFADPAQCIKQIRLNVLLDGKELIMPSPSLKEGFYILSAGEIPFKRRIQAVGNKGLAEFGRKLTLADCRDMTISLFVTAPLAWDEQGNRLGEGRGFFDLSYAVLAELQAISEQARVCGVVSPKQKIASLPSDPWDIRLDFAVSADEVFEFSRTGNENAKILWDKLETKRIKKISPLFQLSAKRLS